MPGSLGKKRRKIMANPPTVKLTFDPVGPEFPITEDDVMPTIKVTANVKDFTPDPKGPPLTYEWKATLVWTGAACLNARGRVIKHPDMTATTTTNTFTIPFTQIRGGDLVISVSAKSGTVNLTAQSDKLKVVGTNPSITKLATEVSTITAFRKLMRVESGLRQFLGSSCPLFSSDGYGGVGLCQLTSPAPTDDQVWSWKANVAGGLALFVAKQNAARQYPEHVRNSAAFKAQVKAYNDKRLAQNAPAAPPSASGAPKAPAALKALDITLPAYTDDQLERDTLRGFNGYPGSLHEYRVKVDKDGLLIVTVDAGGTKGTAEWEQVSVKDRIAFYDSINLAANSRGDPNYVNDVEAKASF